VGAAPVAFSGAQLFGDRVLIVRVAHTDISQVALLDGVSGVYTGEVPEDAELPTDTAGRAAVSAWNARKGTAAPKQRIGEGLPWDDPRFEREGGAEREGGGEGREG
jgi:hypothetical protein